MPKSDESASEPKQTRRRRLTTPEAHERRLINKALDRIEQQIDDGTASSQVLSHYAKLASSRERLEQERLQMEIELGRTKREHLQSLARAEELAEKAIEAFTSYRRSPPEEYDR